MERVEESVWILCLMQIQKEMLLYVKLLYF